MILLKQKNERPTTSTQASIKMQNYLLIFKIHAKMQKQNTIRSVSKDLPKTKALPPPRTVSKR